MKVDDDQRCGDGCKTSFEPLHPSNESPRHPSIHDAATPYPPASAAARLLLLLPARLLPPRRARPGWGSAIRFSRRRQI